jgi:Sulfatase-modifying factor enzyme 1/TIR domain
MIFLLYAREDWRGAKQLEKEIAEHGIRLVKDKPEAESNPFWRQSLAPRLKTAKALLVLWSARARQSPWLDQEIRAGTGRRVWFLLDDASLPDCVQTDEVRTRERPDLIEALRSAVGRRRSRPANAGLFVADWRRDEKVQAAQKAFVRFLSRSQPETELRELGDGHLKHGTTGLEFQRLRASVYLASTAVTVRQYRQFLDATGWHSSPLIRWPELSADAPVVSVTWFEAQAYCYWAGGMLPSQQEWSWAASAGRNLTYSTANGEISPGLAYYGHRFATGRPLPQRLYPSNPAGYAGMCGNTWDWCGDSWGEHRVIRGGCWMDSERFCEVRARYRNAPIDRDCAVGFRVRIACKRRRGGLYLADRQAPAPLERFLLT